MSAVWREVSTWDFRDWICVLGLLGTVTYAVWYKASEIYGRWHARRLDPWQYRAMVNGEKQKGFEVVKDEEKLT